MFKLLKLSLFLMLALIFDLILYGFSIACASCASFAQFLQTPTSLAGPILASLIALTQNLTKRKK